MSKKVVNAGHFRKGHDSRRLTPEKFRNGVAFRDACRDHTEENLAFLQSVVRDPDEQMTLRVKTAQWMLEQAHGKAVSAVAIMEDKSGKAEEMSRAELRARLTTFLRDATEKPVDGVTIDNEP